MLRFYNSVIVILILLPIFISAQTTRNVPSQYSTIQAAIDASISNDIVIVSPGTYNENINFGDKILTLQGSSSPDNTFLNGNGNIGINILGGRIQNFSIYNCTSGIRVNGNYSLPEIFIINCKIYDNSNYGICSTFLANIKIINSLFYHNQTSFYQEYYGSECYIQNSTFSNNTIDINFGPGYSTVVSLNIFNSILRGQVKGTVDNKVILNYCNYDPNLLDNNVIVGEGCQTSAPLFADTTNKNYSLQATSPSINAGSPNSLYKDFDGTRNDLGFTGGRRIFLNRFSFDYGYTALNRTKDLILDIANFSGKSLVLNSIDIGNYQISTDAYVPITISVNSRKLIIFTIQPTSVGLFSSYVKLSFSNDPIASDIAEFQAGSFGISYSDGVIKVPSQAPTIQAAIDASVSNDIILVSPGIYNENINFGGKTLTLQGSSSPDSTFLNGNGKDGITILSGSGGRIKNFSIYNCVTGIRTASGELFIVNCKIYDNSSDGINSFYGQGIRIINSLFHHNPVAFVQWYYGSECYIQNSTFSNNTIDINFGPGYSTVVSLNIFNSILRGQVKGTVDNKVILNYCNYDPTKTGTNVVIQNGNQTANPIFINPSSGNYRLASTSPCIDAGTIDTTGLNLPRIDLDNNNRIWQGRVDIGAYEYGSQKPVMTYTVSVTANPSISGSVVGSGPYNSGSTVTVTATPNNGYGFINWTENSAVVSTNASYTFIINGNRTLVANFQQSIIIKPTVTSNTIPKGTSFWIDIKVGDPQVVSDLYGVSFRINSNNSNCTYVDASAKAGEFLGSSVLFLPQKIDSKTVDVAVSKMSAPGVNGSGIVASLQFISATTITLDQTVVFTLSNLSANNSQGTALSLIPATLSVTITAISTVNVWPGDTNNDLIVNTADLLPIGLYYGQFNGQSGPTSNTPGITWQAYTRQPWSVDGTISKKIFVDANGDGVINATDLLAIGINYGKTHSISGSVLNANIMLSNDELKKVTLDNASVKIITPSKVKNNTNFTVQVSVGDPVTVSDLYGISFRLKSSSATCSYVNNSAVEGNFLGSNILKIFQRIDDQTIDAAVSKMSSPGINGSGTVVTFSFNSSIDQTVSFSLSNVSANDSNGNNILLDVTAASILVDVQKEEVVPIEYNLSQNYPNPFNPTTKIKFGLPENAFTKLIIYDLLGREVATLVNSELIAGYHEVEFNASNISSGIYFFRISSPKFTSVKKLLLMK